MNTTQDRAPFFKPVLSAVFAGIISTVICLGYDIAYRDGTGFSPSGFINVSSIIFVVNILFLITGIVYSLLVASFRKADLIFFVIFLALILFCIWRTLGVQRSPNHEETVQFRGLLIGILVIIGIGMAAIPYLFHNRKFEHDVLDS
jgi:p-aminobenzoyl-glutamate transporter AbgT